MRVDKCSETAIHLKPRRAVFLLALLVALMIIAPTLNFVKTYILLIFTLHLDELFIFVLVMCAEVIMLIDSAELVGE